MPHISPKELQKDHLKSLYSNFVKILDRASKDSKSHIFLNEFLTRTEKIMLAKRLAVIYMLSKGIPEVKIANSLRMSPATISRFSSRIDIGKYEHTLKIFTQDKVFLNILEKLLRAGLPPITGRGRWKYVYKFTENKSKT
jgi:Trp operon repressor